ncbi:MAG: hypothetical protein JSW55_10370 [Chloroflexota bacterium]|nr:MAG: hypothetical protein JSW55_10370 [Chloroflexota bacterium]
MNVARVWFRLLLLAIGMIVLVACSRGDDDSVPAQDTPVSEPTPTADEIEGESLSQPTDEPTSTAVPVTPEGEPTIEEQLSYFGPEFRPERDGFKFRNFGRARRSRVLIENLRELLGDDVCSRVDEDSTCVPTATAQMLLTMINEFREEGHCVGFNVASYRLFTGDLTAADFSPDAGSTFEIEEDKTILTRIALESAQQLLPEVNEALVTGTPNEVLEELRGQDEPVDLIMQSHEGARHSVMAFGLAERSDGLIGILVYDSNYPGETKRILLDTVADTWRYTMADGDPVTGAMAWQGDAASKSLGFIPLSAYTNPTTSLLDQTIIALDGDTDLLISTDEGQIGRWDGQEINSVPGAFLVNSRGSISSRKGNYMLVSGGSAVQAKYKANGRQKQTEANIRIASPSVSVTVDNTRLNEGDQAQINVNPQRQQVGFSSSSNQKPTMKYKVTSAQSSSRPRVELLGRQLFKPLRQESAEVEYLFTFDHLELAADENIILEFDDEARLTLAGDGIADDSIVLVMARLDGQSEQTFAADAIEPHSESGIQLDLNGWEDGGSLTALSDGNGDGQRETVMELQDKPLSDLLAEAKTSHQIISLLGEYGPYMDDSEVSLMLAHLIESELAPDDLGQVLAAFRDAWKLGEDYMVDLELVEATRFAPGELAEFLFALELSESEAESLVNRLDLSPDEQDALWTEWQRQVALYQLLQQWWFLGADVDYLASFLEEHGSSDDYGAFFKELQLVEEQLFNTLGDLDLGESQLTSLYDELSKPYCYLDEDEYDHYFNEYLGYTPTPKPTASATESTPQATISPTSTAQITPTATISPTLLGTPTPTPTSSGTPQTTPTPTGTPQLPITSTPTPTFTPVGPTVTSTWTATPTFTPTNTPQTPTETHTPTLSPTPTPPTPYP